MTIKVAVKKGPRTNKEKEMLRKNVCSRPVFLDSLPSRGGKAKEIAILSEQLKSMASSECVHYNMNEFVEKFIVTKPVKQELAYIRNQLKVRGIRVPRSAENDGIIYFWYNGICNGKVV